MRAPMMQIHTVAAGGGSILHFDGTRYRVGPDSAGANPGPACYRRGGPLCVTDANVMVGKIRASFFPRCSAPTPTRRWTKTSCARSSRRWPPRSSARPATARSPVEVADGFLMIAVENMAKAIKQISIQRGHDVTGYTLNCFGGAGGQHACLVADSLGIGRVFIHPFAGVLSAYGMGLADLRVMRERAVEAILDDALLDELGRRSTEMEEQGRAEMARQGGDAERTYALRKVHLRYEGTDSPLIVDFADRRSIVAEFEAAHHLQYGFIAPEKNHIVEAVTVEVIAGAPDVVDPGARDGRRGGAGAGRRGRDLHGGREPRRPGSTTGRR